MMATETVNVTGTIANDAVTNAKLANMVQGTVKGRAAGAGTGDPQDIGLSTGGNAASDAAKVVSFGSDGSLTATTAIGGGVALTAETGALNTAAVDGFSTNGGEGGKFESIGGDGVLGVSNTGAAIRGTSDTGPGLHVNVTDAGNTTDLALFHRDDNLGLEVRNDGGLVWTAATGAATTRTGLGLGTLATQSGTFSGTSSGTNTGDQTNISGNAATVTTNANLTGPVTSVGNATAIANGAISNAMLANGAVANLSGTNTGDQTTVSGNAGTATALQTARNINGVAFDGTANITISEHHTPFFVRATTPFPYTNLPAAANFFQDAAPPSVFPVDLTHATQARIYVYTATTGSAGSKLSIKYKTGAWSATAGDYSDIGTSEVAATVSAGNTFTDSGWVNLAAGAKTEVYVSVFGLGGNGVADPTFNILGVQFR